MPGTPTQRLIARVTLDEWRGLWSSTYTGSYGSMLDIVAERVHARIGSPGISLERCHRAAHTYGNHAHRSGGAMRSRIPTL